MPILVNAYSTLRELPEIDFPHQLNGIRSLDDPELGEHLNEFLGYILQAGDGKMNVARYATLRHIQRVRHHCSMQIEGPAYKAYAQWAARANVLSFMPDGTVCDLEGRVLVYPDERVADEGAQAPHPADAWARKNRNDASLKALQITALESCPV